MTEDLSLDPPSDAIEALLPAYALNALDAADRDLVERALEQRPRYRRVLAEYLGTVGQLANIHRPVAPSAALRGRVFAAFTQLPAQMGPVAAAPQPRPVGQQRKAFRGGIAAWASAAAVVALVGLGSLSVVQYQQVQDLSRDMEMLAGEAEETEHRLVAQQSLTYWVAQPDVDTVTMRPVASRTVSALGYSDNTSNARGVVMRAPDGTSVLVVMNMPLLPEYHSYQSWAWDNQGQPHSLGVFEVDANGYAQVLVDDSLRTRDAYLVSVSVEPAGGSVEPSGTTMLSGSAALP